MSILEIMLIVALAILAVFVGKLLFEIKISLWKLKWKTDGESIESK